jgi:hypothetical protein
MENFGKVGIGVQRRVEQSAVAKRSQRPQPLVKNSSTSVVTARADMGLSRGVRVGGNGR